MTTAIVSMLDVSGVISLVLDGLTSTRSKAAYRAALHRFLDRAGVLGLGETGLQV